MKMNKTKKACTWNANIVLALTLALILFSNIAYTQYFNFTATDIENITNKMFLKDGSSYFLTYHEIMTIFKEGGMFEYNLYYLENLSKTNDAKKNIVSVNNDISSLKEEINNTSGQLSNVENDITSLDTKKDGLEQSQSLLQSLLAGLKNDQQKLLDSVSGSYIVTRTQFGIIALLIVLILIISSYSGISRWLSEGTKTEEIEKKEPTMPETPKETTETPPEAATETPAETQPETATETPKETQPTKPETPSKEPNSQETVKPEDQPKSWEKE